MAMIGKYLKVYAVLASSVIVVSCSTLETPLITDNSEFYAEIPFSWIGQINFALADFKGTETYERYQNNIDAPCFIIETYKEDEKYYVNFMPKSNIVEDGDLLIIDPKSSNYCGRGMSYEFDKAGQFVRRIRQR